MTREDLKHKLLSGCAIYIDGGVIYLDDCPTYKVTLQDMADFGFGQMQDVIALMASDDASASKFLNNIDGTVSTFYVLMVGIVQELRQVTNQGEKQEAALYDSALAFLSLFFNCSPFKNFTVSIILFAPTSLFS